MEHCTPQLWITLFAEACETEPIERALVTLENYKGLKPPFDDWAFVRCTCNQLGRTLLKLELQDTLPKALPHHWPKSFSSQP